ncbi:hypothetical protein AGMMS49938_00200 [Fibrobacterales bacterium]|nr:hypothetical protein AGMMS49938_00200 [Fibrobacterales bacterium]
MFQNEKILKEIPPANTQGEIGGGRSGNFDKKLPIKGGLLKHITAVIAGLIALITYAITMAPTVSFWDCGEFVASAFELGIPHPPGTPFFVFFARAVIILLPMVDEIAKRVNYISVVTSAATVYITVLFAWELLSKTIKTAPKFVFVAASLSAGLLLAFSDTFWFNAVEAEVYGFAMFIVMLISYLALLYLDVRNEKRGNQYLILICYLGFLGVGIHLYTMLTIPAVFVLLLFADGTPLKTLANRFPLWITGVILYSVVYAVSHFIWWSFALLVVLFFAWLFTKKSPLHKDISLSLAFTVVALIGFSTHLYIPIRSELNPIIDENNPEINFRDEQGNLQLGNLLEDKNWLAFNDYVERKQYGSESMISRAFYRRAQFDNQVMVFPHMGYGGYQIAQYTPFKVGEVSYYRAGIYSIDAEVNPPVERGSWKFPTLMTTIGENEFAQGILFLLFNGLLVWTIYIAWKRNKPIGIYLAFLYGFCSAGLLWYINFADGTKTEGRDYDMWKNEMSKITEEFASRGMAGRISNIPDPNELLTIQRKIYTALARGEKNIPEEQSSAWQNWKRIQTAFTSQGYQAPSLPDPVHLEVRNRDYFYTPAFILMSLIYGVGIGYLLLHILQSRRGSFAKPAGILIAILCGAVPLFANYKEHNRANLWVPWDYAYNLLMSCEPNAILFTNGDNDTFPLWFAQEVAGIRKDVRVVNLSLGNTDWYIKQMLENPPILKLSYNKAGIDNDMVLSEKNYGSQNQRIDGWVARAEQAIPTLNRQIEILNNRLDSLISLQVAEKSTENGGAKNAVKNGTESNNAELDKTKADLEKRKLWLQTYTALKDWGEAHKGGVMQTQYKLVIDLTMNNPDRPIHISTTVGLSNGVGLDKYMVQKGMIWDLVKGNLTPSKDSIDFDRTAYLVDSVFQYRGLGDGTAHIDDETEQLLFNYNSMYIRLAMSLRDSLTLAKTPETPSLTSIENVLANKDENMKRILEKGLHYADLGIKQFPSEWRNYVIAADLLQTYGDDSGAVEYLEKGVQNTPESASKRYIQPQLTVLKNRE